MRPILILFVTALVGAIAATAATRPRPLDDYALDLRLQQAVPAHADELHDQPAPVRKAFIGYTGDEELILNARLALLRHPALAPRVIALYAERRAFQLVLREHGPAVIPPIHYFLTHEPTTLGLRARVVSRLSHWDGEAGSRPAVLSPQQRGLYAIEFIRREGHDFLGQFVTDAQNEVQWIQTERFATEVKRFFTSGLTALETRHALDQPTRADDYGWAAVDLLLPFALFKGARLGKAVAGGRIATRTARATRAGATAVQTARIARFGRTALKAGAIAGTAYVVMNPGVIGSIGAQLSEWTGLPAWLITTGLWFLLLAPLLTLLLFAYRWLLRPLLSMLAGAGAGGRYLHRRVVDHHGRA